MLRIHQSRASLIEMLFHSSVALTTEWRSSSVYICSIADRSGLYGANEEAGYCLQSGMPYKPEQQEARHHPADGSSYAVGWRGPWTCYRIISFLYCTASEITINHYQTCYVLKPWEMYASISNYWHSPKLTTLYDTGVSRKRDVGQQNDELRSEIRQWREHFSSVSYCIG